MVFFDFEWYTDDDVICSHACFPSSVSDLKQISGSQFTLSLHVFLLSIWSGTDPRVSVYPFLTCFSPQYLIRNRSTGLSLPIPYLFFSSVSDPEQITESQFTLSLLEWIQQHSQHEELSPQVNVPANEGQR
jgi:hypothetical protein